MKILAAVLPGGLFACIASAFLTMVFIDGAASIWYPVLLFAALWIFAAVFCHRAAGNRTAWFRMILALGIALLLLPWGLYAWLHRPMALPNYMSVAQGMVVLKFVSIVSWLLALNCAGISYVLRPKKNAQPAAT